MCADIVLRLRNTIDLVTVVNVRGEHGPLGIPVQAEVLTVDTRIDHSIRHACKI